MPPSPNGYFSDVFATNIGRDWFRLHLQYDSLNPPWLPGQVGNYSLSIGIATAQAGPFTPAPLTEIGSPCAASKTQPFPPNDPLETIVGVGGPLVLDPDTDYWLHITLRDPGNNVAEDYTLPAAVRTEAYPAFTCLANVPTQTSYTQILGLLTGAVSQTPPCDQDTMVWEIAAHPAGPWTASPAEPMDSAPTHAFTGLVPSTTYYTRAHFRDRDGVEYGTSPVCTWTTLAETPETPRQGVCEPWPIRPAAGCCTTEDAGASQEDKDFAALAATELLWRLTGMRWGPGCPVTIRPCSRTCGEEMLAGLGYGPGYWGAGTPFVPYIGRDGSWYNFRGCGCTTTCGCSELSEITLDGPVYDIVSVVENGVTLSPGAYRVDFAGGWRLVRTDGGAFASCQDLAAPPGTANTLAVTYRLGLPLDNLAIRAVSALYCAMLKTCGGAGSCGCKLPANMTRMSRQGVDIELQSLTELTAAGLTGIKAVDEFILAVNPYGLRSASRVWSPDYKRARRVVLP